MADDRQQQLADVLRAAAQAAEDTSCDMGVVVGRADDDCPSCSAPVKVASTSTIDGHIVEVYADVDGLVTLLLPLLDRVAADAAAKALEQAAEAAVSWGFTVQLRDRMHHLLTEEELRARAAELRAPRPHRRGELT